MSITIEDKYLNRIKIPLAYPSVEKVILTDPQIKELCIQPALESYYTKFPKKDIYTANISSNTEVTVPFPDAETFGCVDTRITDKFSSNSTGKDNFWGIYAFNQYGDFNGNNSLYGIKGFNPNSLRQQNATQYQAQRSMIKNLNTVRIKVDTDKREVVVYTNQVGKIFIEWAKWSEDFNDIQFQQINNVISLAQSNLLNQLADTTGMINNNSLEVTVNADELRSKATELRDKVFEIWEQYPDITLISM